MKIKKIAIFLALVFLTICPTMALAQNAQQNYPNIGGNELIGNTASESIPKLVMYLFNLAVWLCILTAIIVLIVGGIQYLSSSGQVSKMASAKTRIYGSFLGLLILIGAWFVLHTMNPQIVIPKITYQPIKNGIILFTKQGYEELNNKKDISLINDILQRQDAFYLNYSEPDLTSIYGPLIWHPNDLMANKPLANESLNLENFQLYAIGFWGKQDAQSIVTTYPQAGYRGANNIVHRYTYKGLIDEQGELFASNTGKQITPLVVDTMNIFIIKRERDGAAQYFDVNKYVCTEPSGTSCPKAKITVNNDLLDQAKRKIILADNNKKALSNADNNVDAPPLSLKVSRNAPGIYLYSQNGDERYFDASVANFKSPEIDFDKKAKEIKIINDVEYEYTDLNGEKQTQKESHDFLAILHEKDNFSGNLKIYFEQRRYNIENANNIVANTAKGKGRLVPVFDEWGVPISEEKASTMSGVFKDQVSNFYYYKQLIFGTLPTLKIGGNDIVNKEPINQKDRVAYQIEKKRYGMFNEGVAPASVSIYELAEDQTVCQEVKLCSEAKGLGYCITYIAEGEPVGKEDKSVFYPMPVYVPQNIPCISGLDPESECTLPQFTSGSGENKPFSFANKVKSISIKGKCAVVLFDHSLIFTGNRKNDPAFADDVPGSRSEVFTSSDYNLEDNQIGLCGSIGIWNKYIGRECASAIVVYPIK